MGGADHDAVEDSGPGRRVAVLGLPARIALGGRREDLLGLVPLLVGYEAEFLKVLLAEGASRITRLE